MILLDTNVVSEIMKPTPAPAVAAWIETVQADEAALAATSLAELLYGLRLMPDGARKAAKRDAFLDFIGALRVLPFDDRAAAWYAIIATERRASGRPISAFDAQIAATARLYDAPVATRDIGGFEGCGIAVIDPWSHRT